MICDLRGSKVNFVDENNVVLGYDLQQDCCEHAGWVIGPMPATEINETVECEAPSTLGDYVFDTDVPHGEDSVRLRDGGGSVAFALKPKPGVALPVLWITLYNSHNGHYSHGFKFDVGGKPAIDGRL